MTRLYGDGIHDDTAAIQQLLDTRHEVALPEPETYYLISRPLEIGPDTRLILPRYARIRLADNSNCVMLRSKMRYAPAKRLPEGISEGLRHISIHADDYSPEAIVRNIEIVGGIWDFNNKGQNPNPLQSGDYSIREFSGHGMLFYGVRDLRLADMTLKDPTNFAVALDTASYFTVENIQFDYNAHAANMDGIHLYGNCHFGVIRNLKGACYDDLVALNADEGSHGPITNIEIDGIFAEECHSAVRLLSVHHAVEKIHIANVYGTYYEYCIGISKFYPGVCDGGYDMISIDHIYASKAVRLPYLYPNTSIALIWIQDELNIKNLAISALHRREYNVPVRTIYIGRNTVIDSFILDDVTSENYTGEPMPLIVNHGTLRSFVRRNIRSGGDEELINHGVIDC